MTPFSSYEEDTPSRVPALRVIGFTTRTFVESDDASDSDTHLSCSSLIVLLKSTRACANSKKQGSCETSSF